MVFGRRALIVMAIGALAPTMVMANHVDFIQDDSNPGNGITNATFSLSTGGPKVSDIQSGEGADILGGIRSASLTNNGGFGGTTTAEKVAGTDFIDVQNSTVAAGTLVLDYPGIANSDFSSSWNFIAVDIPFLDNLVGDGELNLSVTVTSSAGTGTAFANGTGLAPGRIEDPGVYFFSFTDPDFVGVDFSDVEGISVTFESAIIGTDFQIASITREVVPEPGSIALLGLGTIGFFIRRNR